MILRKQKSPSSMKLKQASRTLVLGGLCLGLSEAPVSAPTSLSEPEPWYHRMAPWQKAEAVHGPVQAQALPIFTPPPGLNPFGLVDVGFYSNPVFADIDGDGDLDAFSGENTGNTIYFENTGSPNSPAFATPQTNPFGFSGVSLKSNPAFADLDNDGDLDAFIGEEDGNTIYFENTGSPNSPAFATPQTNPFGLSDVGFYSSPAFVDIDKDGDLDAFSGEAFGDTIYFENTGSANSPAFAAPKTNPFGLSDVGRGSSPVFADLDDDGDFDAFIGERGGNTVYFENIGSANSPGFAFRGTNPFGLEEVGYHPFSRNALNFADLDDDGDLDAFIGERGGDTFYFENTGSPNSPAFTQLSPFGLKDVGDFSRSAFADLDDDGDLDALIGEEDGNTFYFENTGAPTSPAFAAPQTNPFGLRDVGFRVSPSFADLDNDGDLDVFFGEISGNTIYFENTGSPNSPAFAAPRTNPFGLSGVGTRSTPTFTDLDADGDLDAFIGENLSKSFFFFENTGSATNPAFATPQANPFGLTDVSTYSSPVFADLDGDGDLDILTGEFEGGTIYFQNTGSATNPAFTTPLTNPFGLEDVGRISVPTLADLDGDGDLDVLIGERSGHTFYFENISAVPDTTPPICEMTAFNPGPPTTIEVTAQDNESGLAAIHILKGENTNIEVSPFSAGTNDPVMVTAEKIDPTRKAQVVLEVVDQAGNTTTCDPVVTRISAQVPEAFQLDQNYPNPFNPTTQIEYALPEASRVRLAIYDVQGREVTVLVEGQQAAGTYAVSFSGLGLPSGLYVYRLEAGAYSQMRMMMLVK